MPRTEGDPAFEELLAFLKDNRGFDFTGYKRSTLARRINHRLQAVGAKSYGEYLDFLELNQEEFTALFDTVLINVTGFFRDGSAWQALRTVVLPDLVAQSERPLRVWSAGCATGEEAYTLAMVLAEALGPDEFREHVKIYATDADESALETARAAIYPERALTSIPDELREKYFEPQGEGHMFHRDLRRSVIFGRNDLTQDAPISRVHLLVSRNTLMYFNAETQSRILNRFHFAVNDTGYLFLGKAEMLLNRGDLFSPVDLRRRIFRKVITKGGRKIEAVAAPAAPEANREKQLEMAALASSPVAQIAVDPQGVLIIANASAQAMFNVNHRDVGRLFHDLEISYRPVELRSRIDEVTSHRRPLELYDIEWRKKPDGDPVFFNVLITPLFHDDTFVGVGITFADITHYRHLRAELEQANQDLERAYEELQSTNEELETTNEELQSTNEELETTNEELQSTVEELETMNEELQSTNEELQDINQQLRTRSVELDRANAFLDSILGSLSDAVVVIDLAQRVQAWSPGAEELWGLRQDEVLGTNFFTLDFGLPTREIAPALRPLLAGTERRREQAVLTAVNRRGRELRVTVTPVPLMDALGQVTGILLMMEAVAEEAGATRPEA
jgi:two-component system, chemotaxis family, CheB/CheR fusion protein